LLGVARDGVEIAVVVQDLQTPDPCGRRDDEIGNRGRPVLCLLGQRFLDLRCPLPDVLGSINAVHGCFELLFHPGPFLNVARGVEHLQFRDTADADQRAGNQRL
jgi:hypothetical protein